MIDFYKVYSKACRTVHPIYSMSPSEVKEDIFELVDFNIERPEVQRKLSEDESTLERQLLALSNLGHELALDTLLENNILNCGDFMIVRAESEPTTRPNCCGYENFADKLCEKLLTIE